MSEAFVPYAPLDVPKPLAEGVWLVDGPEIRFAYAGLRLPFSTRMTIVRLPSGGLWIHSPIEPSEALFDRIGQLGEVAVIVAPNTLHYWWLPAWSERFPRALRFGPASLADRAKRALPSFVALAGEPPAAFEGAFDQALVTGAILDELVFFHRPSRTLVLTDLIENFEPARVVGRWMRLLIRLGGVADPDGKAPYDMQWSFRKQRGEVKRVAELMLGWAPERVVLSHGRCYEVEATRELRRAFRWALRRAD